MTPCPPPGIYHDIPHADYLAWDAVSSTYLRDLIALSPMEARHNRDHSRPDTAALIFGRRAHTLFCEGPAAFSARYAIEPRWSHSGSTKIGKASRAAFSAATGGREAITYTDACTLAAMHVRALGKRASLTGDAELSLVWTDCASGATCKARIDVLGDGFATDYKTFRGSVDSGSWGKEVVNRLLHVQAGMYLSGCEACGLDVREWRWVAQSKASPYACAVYALEPGDPWLEMGTQLYHGALDLHGRCAGIGDYPGYPDDPQALRMPAWVGTRCEEDEQRMKAVDFGY
jgi:hypothetical protein